MKEKQEYRSSRRSRRLIREAFEELLQQREFSKITVIDVVERADLNRSTFYAHYPDIFGILHASGHIKPHHKKPRAFLKRIGNWQLSQIVPERSIGMCRALSVRGIREDFRKLWVSPAHPVEMAGFAAEL